MHYPQHYRGTAEVYTPGHARVSTPYTVTKAIWRSATDLALDMQAADGTTYTFTLTSQDGISFLGQDGVIAVQVLLWIDEDEEVHLAGAWQESQRRKNAWIVDLSPVDRL